MLEKKIQKKKKQTKTLQAFTHTYNANILIKFTWHWYIFLGLWLKSENGIRFPRKLNIFFFFNSIWVVICKNKIKLSLKTTHNTIQNKNPFYEISNNFVILQDVGSYSNIKTLAKVSPLYKLRGQDFNWNWL